GNSTVALFQLRRRRNQIRATTTTPAEATLQPDGVTLRLEKKLALAPGRVLVTVQPTESRSGPTMLEVLDRIHREQQRGRPPMSEEEMAAEIAQLRAEDDEYEERLAEIGSQAGTKRQGTDNP